MLVGILSDTHGYFHPQLPDVLSKCDLILHAGDIGRVEILDSLAEIAPVRAVYGNIDGQDIRRMTREDDRFAVEGVQIWMTHIGGTPQRWDRRVRDEFRSDPPSLFICGHSHILRIERVRSLRNMVYLNPGAAGRYGLHRVKTCVRLKISEGVMRDAEVVHLE